MTMDELKPKQSAYIRSVGGAGALRHHLLDMGLTPAVSDMMGMGIDTVIALLDGLLGKA